MTTPVPPPLAERVDPRLVLGGCVLLLGLPHLLAGPGLMADDWVWVRNGEFLAWWDAGGSRQIGRPGAYGLYAVVFGAGGARPLVHALVLVGLWLAATLVLHATLRRLLDERFAFGCTLVWLLAPSHLTLEWWASTAQAWVAVLALAGGAWCLAGEGRARRGLGWALLAASGTFYEVAMPAVPVVAAAVDRVRTSRWRIQPLVAGAVAILPAAAWSVRSASLYASAVITTEDRWAQHLAAPLAMGISVSEEAIAAIVLAVVAAVTAVLVRRARRGEGQLAERGAVVGLAVSVAASLPGLRSYTIPVGMGDRLMAVSGIGAALFWYGAGAGVLRVLDDRRRRLAIVALAFVAVFLRVGPFVEWTELEDEIPGTASAIVERRGAGDLVVVEGPLLDRDNYYGLHDGWNATAAAQVVGDDPDLVVQVDIECIRSGPFADDPLEQYGDRGEPRTPDCER